MKRFSHSISIWLLSIWTLSAQNLVTNDNSLVVINSDVPFVVEGSVHNNGLISNEGALRLYGNWTNGGDYRSVSGTFSLLGENQIFMPGNSEYSHLIVNSTGIAIMDDLIITQSLDLQEGIVSLMPDALIYIESDASILGGHESSYIDGSLYISPRTQFTFPIGTDAEYLPITVSGIVANDSIGAKAFSTGYDGLINEGIDAFSNARYWQLLGPIAAQEIELPLKNESFLESEDEAVILYSNDSNYPLDILGIPEISGSITNGSITTSGRILSGYYLIGDKSVDGPPITVINLVTALQDGKHDFLRINNIEFYENNLVEIFDRQGVKVFEMRGYNNQDRVFRGNANVGTRGMLETGSYYYTVQLTESKREQGFIYVKN